MGHLLTLASDNQDWPAYSKDTGITIDVARRDRQRIGQLTVDAS